MFADMPCFGDSEVDMTNILLCGVGGQGIVLTSKLIAAAAMEKGTDVRSAETIGMAQKGGSVVSYLRVGKCRAPMFREGQADIMISFEPAEAVREIRYLRPGGTVILNTHPVMPVTAALTGGKYDPSEMTGYIRGCGFRLIALDAQKIAEEIGSARSANMVMLSAAVQSGVLPFTRDEIAQVMKKTVRPQFIDINMKALMYGIIRKD